MSLPKFRYVFIPADVNEPIQEREMEIPEGQDVECFLDSCKRHFSAGSRERSEAQLKAQREQLLKQLGDAAKDVDPGLLNTAMNMQMVENISLLPNGRETAFVGVNLYCDDQAQIKGLELNPRASQMAQCCGKMIEVRGDAFVARVFDNEDDFKRLDFTMADVSSSAEWVGRAAQIAHRKQNDTSYAAQKEFLEKMQGQRPAGGSMPRTQPPQIRELTPAEVAKDDGNDAFKKGDWQRAIDRYSAALALDPTMLPALNNRALARLKLQQYAEAEQDCSQVLETEPNNVKALLRRAAARESLPGKRLEAVQDVEAALKIEPSNREGNAMLQRLLPPPPATQDP